MFNKRAMRGWRQMLVNQGATATLRAAMARVATRFKPRSPGAPVSPASDHPAIHSFDRAYGVDTSGLIWGEYLETESKNDRWNTAYYGIAPSVFRTLMEHIEVALPGATFIDMGSGKGRGVMLAMSYPFRAVYGVELSPHLSAIAQLNVEKYREAVSSSASLHLLCMDAMDFQFPAEPLVLFFYHPFCRPVLRKVLQNLKQSLQLHPRPAYIVYVNTELRRILDSSSFLTRVFESTIPMSEEDQLDDRVGSTQEECAIYRSTLG